MCADRCHPHGARACRRCETPGGHLDAGKLEQLRRAYDNENWRGWGVTRVVHDLIDALVAERAAHAATKAELAEARSGGMGSIELGLFGTWRGFAEHLAYLGTPDVLAQAIKERGLAQRRADVLAAKVARVEALPAKWDATRGFHKMICAEQLRAALAGDGDD